MAFDYNCDFDLQSYRLTPITKRQDVRLDILKCVAAPIQWNLDLFFGNYFNGSNYSAYNNVTAYSKYDRVNYQNRIYECIKSSTGNLPTNTLFWVQILTYFRGAVERIKYNCQTIMLEWILNKWFATTFRQPVSGNSDFYIVNHARDVSTFTAYEQPVISGVYIASTVYELPETATEWVCQNPGYSFGSNFTVHYPVAVIATITDDKYYQMIQLINKYKIFGSTVDYISY